MILRLLGIKEKAPSGDWV